MRGSHPVLSLRTGLKRHACPLASANSAGHLPNRVTMSMSATRSNQLLPRGGVCNTLFYIPEEADAQLPPKHHRQAVWYAISLQDRKAD